MLGEDVMCAAKVTGLLAARLRLSPPEAAGPADILVQLIRAPTCRIELGLIRYRYPGLRIRIRTRFRLRTRIWIRIQLGQWIRIQEGKNDPQK